MNADDLKRPTKQFALRVLKLVAALPNTVAGKPRRKKVLDEFIFDTSRCMFCALCQEACPTYCLELTQDFELATYSRAGFVWNREMLEQGRETVKYTS